jgi:hypothetical protein
MSLKSNGMTHCHELLHKFESLPKTHGKTSLAHQCEAASDLKLLPQYPSQTLPE